MYQVLQKHVCNKFVITFQQFSTISIFVDKTGSKTYEELYKQLDELKQELAELRLAKVLTFLKPSQIVEMVFKTIKIRSISMIFSKFSLIFSKMKQGHRWRRPQVVQDPPCPQGHRSHLDRRRKISDFLSLLDKNRSKIQNVAPKFKFSFFTRNWNKFQKLIISL